MCLAESKCQQPTELDCRWCMLNQLQRWGETVPVFGDQTNKKRELLLVGLGAYPLEFYGGWNPQLPTEPVRVHPAQIISEEEKRFATVATFTNLIPEIRRVSNAETGVDHEDRNCFKSHKWLRSFPQRAMAPWASPGRWGRCVCGNCHESVWGVWGVWAVGGC